MFQGLRLFVKECRRDLRTVGAVAPSSPALARAMLRPLSDRPDRPIRILEAGPGTGAFTREVLRRLRPGDALDIVELNPVFCSHLAASLGLEAWRQRGIRARLHSRDIRAFRGDAPYDYILSGLPFANFEADMVAQIFEVYLEQLAAGGTLSYFEYHLPHPLRLAFLKRAEHARLEAVLQTVRAYQRQYLCRSDKIWLNLPPAHARHLQKRSMAPGLA